MDSAAFATTTEPFDAIEVVPKARETGLITLEVAGVSKAYGARQALHDVSFATRGGEFVAILGPSGAGKTTLIGCMTNLLQADSGEVRLDGIAVAKLKRRERRRIAVVFQQFNLVARLSALENVLAGRLGFVPAWRGICRRFTRRDRLLALECLARVGMLEHAAQRADTLSGGQQQRVAIARALAQQPEMIVADEPIASLDPAISADILELLRAICHTDGVAVLCSLHQHHLATQFADRVVGLSSGRLVVDGPGSAFDPDAATRLYGGLEES